MSNKKYFFFVGAIIIYACIGYFRDYLFININFELGDLYYNVNDNNPPYWMRYLPSDYFNLYYFKYLLTFLFILIFLVICCSVSYIIFKSKTYVYWCIILYTAIVVIATFLNMLSLLGLNTNQSYLFSRELLGLLQSPLIMVVINLVFFYLKKIEK